MAPKGAADRPSANGPAYATDASGAPYKANPRSARFRRILARNLPICLRPWIRHLGNRFAVGIEFRKLMPVVKVSPFGVVDEGFRRGIFSQYERMIVDLDMIVDERGRHLRFLHDRSPVDEGTSLNQDSVHEQRMVLRQDKIARRNAFAERTGPHPDRHACSFGKAGHDRLTAEPAHRHRAAVNRQHQVSGLQKFYRHFAAGRRDARALHEAQLHDEAGILVQLVARVAAGIVIGEEEIVTGRSLHR